MNKLKTSATSVWQAFLEACAFISAHYDQVPPRFRKAIHVFVVVIGTVAAVLSALSPFVAGLNLGASYTWAFTVGASVLTTLIHALAPFVTVPAKRALRRRTLRGKYKTGRVVDPTFKGVRAQLAAVLRAPLPQAPDAVAPPVAPAGGWGMLGNDVEGDCTIAGMAHAEMARALEKGLPVPSFTTALCHAVYRKLSGGQDTGLDERVVLTAASASTAPIAIPGDKGGLFGYGPVAGFAGAHLDAGTLEQIIAAFGWAYLAVLVPSSAMDQFDKGEPWHFDPAADNRIEGGHAIPVVGYDRNARLFYVITWGKVQPVSYEWLFDATGAPRFIEECWAVVAADEPLVDVPALQAIIGAVPPGPDTVVIAPGVTAQAPPVV